jgi:hypothetical protein
MVLRRESHRHGRHRRVFGDSAHLCRRYSEPSSVQVGDLSWIHDDPHLIVHDDGTVVLDNDWWLNDEAGTTFSPEVVDHLRRNPRPPITMAAMRARRGAAWRIIPTTVLLGRTDQLVTDEERRWATAHLNDVRSLETDHFVRETSLSLRVSSPCGPTCPASRPTGVHRRRSSNPTRSW